ncbi:MAG TPA: hypothetical protein VGS80_17740 [Ktedonobacterales bacterium]|nr:hypothetical protein [Ktedonobacterales bacterium]
MTDYHDWERGSGMSPQHVSAIRSTRSSDNPAKTWVLALLALCWVNVVSCDLA